MQAGRTFPLTDVCPRQTSILISEKVIARSTSLSAAELA
ncbi:hypothetical protein HGR_07351 [Hylemonella gracilis ATCC 19624]|uniref:Uncharacterized protein n=1 Tax=Hylemonella gracilis ATCC 19624 TaxID=887062 RepID=F3KSP1_9BURK|nr:hypothetical protein HGR_07351 [Hylemonella gracilis ATCC 19624]